MTEQDKAELVAAILRAAESLWPLHPGKDALTALARELTEPKE